MPSSYVGRLKSCVPLSQGCADCAHGKPFVRSSPSGRRLRFGRRLQITPAARTPIENNQAFATAALTCAKTTNRSWIRANAENGILRPADRRGSVPDSSDFAPIARARCFSLSVRARAQTKYEARCMNHKAEQQALVPLRPLAILGYLREAYWRAAV